MDTIFALATAQGKSGVAVVRISGPQACAAAQSLCGGLPPPRQVALRIIKDQDEKRIDQALVLRFAENASFTGEDVVEFHLHGSVAVVSSILSLLGAIPGLRMADPGEFTRRALENGCMDLSQVEGLADLIEAETECQRRQAMRVLAGDLGRKTEAWRGNLIRAAALLEATIDFADEEVPEDVSFEVCDLLADVQKSLTLELNGINAAERIRSGYEVAIIGKPNVGKSTLLNMLAGRDAAITSEIAGTTRDVVEVRMDLSGVPVTLLDTAGVRETDDLVEGLGIERAIQRAEGADLRVFLVEDDLPDVTVEKHDIVIQAKADIRGGQGVSGLTGQGVDMLVERITSQLSEMSSSAGLATRARHREAMTKARKSLKNAMELVGEGSEFYDVGAEEVRISIRALDQLVGRIDVENVLDEIFSSFCLGK